VGPQHPQLRERALPRAYREYPDFLGGAAWTDAERVFWCRADRLDLPDPAIDQAAQLYNLDAVAYESLLLGLFEIHLGPENKVCEEQGRPKITDLKTAFSRDGFHWHRSDRTAFIPAARREGVWDRGYVQSVGGVCVIVGDELWFYYTGFRGDPANRPDAFGYCGGMYAHGATGIARLRRDGFASLRARGEERSLLMRPVLFTGGQPERKARRERRGRPHGDRQEPCPVCVSVPFSKGYQQWREIPRFSSRALGFRFWEQKPLLEICVDCAEPSDTVQVNGYGID